MKKFLSLLLALTLVVGMLSAFTVSAAVNTTVFYNALTNEQITSLDGVDSIYATTTFIGRYEDNASVIANHYDESGKLTAVEFINPVESTIGASVVYTTPVISVGTTDIIKIFAWTGVDTIKPLLKFPGVISRNEEIPLPTATVTELNVEEITDVPLTFAMNFKADPVTEAQLLAYGNWYADYELKINKDVTFNLDGTKDGYLAGQYDSWSPAWVTVPKMDVTLAANTPLKIMETASELYGKPGVGAPGLKYTCQEVFDRVKDFDCGVFFSDEFLAANPDIYVTLELRIYNPLNESESYLINSETYEFGKIPGAVEPVDYTNAPYAGVYQVTTDKAVTVTNETGHTVTLAAGETKYFYLIKGNNNITVSDASANVTFTKLEGNGMDYISEVAVATVPLTNSSSSDAYASATFISADGNHNVGSTYLILDTGVTASFTLNAPTAGLYYMQIQMNDNNKNKLYVETDTGYYGTLQQTTWGWGTFEDGSSDLVMVYCREGVNTITVKNEGTAPTTIGLAKLKKSAELNDAVKFPQYVPQLNYENCKVVAYVASEAPEATPTPVPTATPEPTPEATPDVPVVEGVEYTDAPYAGVYTVTSDKAVTITNETGHTATLAAGVPAYFYLLKGNNNITDINGATLTFATLANNGMDYINQVNAGTTPIISTNTYMGGGDGTNIKDYYKTSENGNCTAGSGYVQIAVGATAVFKVTPNAGAGLYYMQLQLNDYNKNQMYIETDTGYYCEIGQYQYGWNAYVTSAQDDIECVYLRDGENTIKVTNNGSAIATLGGVKISRTNSLIGSAYEAQANLASCNVIPYVAETTKVTTEASVLTYANVTAEVPAGVVLNGKSLSLTTTALENSESGVEAGENEKLSAFDVHVAGVSEENTTPIIVTINEATEPGYNKGNLSLFHVEDGVAVPMEEVETKADLVKHNQFTYDPADGTISLAMANFSEIALLATNTKVWNGNYDYSWYSADKTTFEIANADQMAGFSAIVGGMNGQKEDTFLGKTVKLIADLDFGGVAVAEPNDQPGDVFYPVGYYNTEGTYPKSGTAITSGMKPFEGTFDGNGHTIANIFQTTWIMKGDHNWYTPEEQHYRDGMGIFGKVYGGTIKNLTVDNFISVGEITTTGVIASYAESWNGRSAVFENIALTNCNPQVYNIGNGGIVGSGGWYSQDETDIANTPIIFRNITVDNTNKISALWGSWDVACAGIMGRYYPDSNCGVYFENCHVAAQIDVYNDVCGNYQYYWYRYAGMMIGTVEKSTTDEKGYTVPDLTGITAKDCTVHFGDWNNYYYCEMVVNSLASYTHDHQFSRLTEVDSVDVNAMTVTVDGKTTAIPTSGRYNYVVVNGNHATENATCYHFVDGAVWNHEDAGYETFDLNGDGELNDLKEDRQHYYLPFNQLFQGDGWGVKNIPVYNGEDYAFEGITILDRVVADSVVKFESKHVASVNTGTSLTVGDLFKVVDNGVDVVTENVQVAVSPVIYDGNTANATINVNDDWTKSTINFTGYGKVEITITDYYFCTPTTIVVDVEDTLPSIIDDGEAFVKHVAECGGMIALPNAGSNMITVHTADNDGWFSFKIGVPEDDTYVLQAILLDTNEYGKVYGNGITFTHTDGRELAIPNSNNEVVLIAGIWHTIGEITLEEGNHTFIVENNDTANGYSFWGIRLVKPEDLIVDKFEGTTVNKQLVYGKDGKTTATVTLGDLFTAIDGVEIDSANVTVAANGATVAKADDWKQTTLTYTAAGEYTVTIKDGDNCIPANATVNVSAAAKVDKWTGGKTANAKLAYGANSVEVNFTDLFTDNGYTKGTMTVTGGTYNASTGKVTVSCTKAGDYKVTITDDSGYANIAESTVKVAAPDAVQKFTGRTVTLTRTVAEAASGTKETTLGTLFGNGTYASYIKANQITVTGATVTVNTTDWTQSKVVINGTGTINVTITDDDYCQAATAKVTVQNPTSNVKKWNTKNISTINLTLDNYNTTQSINFADMFTATGEYIKTSDVAVTITSAPSNSGATITGKGTSSVFNYKVGGTYKVQVTDGFYCDPTVITITVKDPAKVNKWTVKANPSYEIKANATQSVRLDTLFNANGNTIGGTVTYKVDGVTAGTATKDNWSSKNVALGIGTHKVSIIDSHFSASEVEATVTITEMKPVQKFDAVDKYIYREHPYGDLGGTQSFTMTLGEIFKATGTGTINSATVEVKASATAYAESVASHKSTTPLTVSVQPNTSDWTKSVVTLNGNGEATFTITDNDYCLTAKAVVGVSPYWAGNVDSGGVDTEGNNVNNGGYYQSNHYSSKKHRTSADLKIGAGETKEIVFNSSAGVISYDGVYGLCFDLSDAANLRVQTASGYYVDIVTASGDWTDDQGADAPLYIKKGEKVTVTNRGSAEITIVSGSMATELQNGNYDDMDFFPLVKANTLAINPNSTLIPNPGDAADPDTPDTPDVPEQTESEPTAPSEMSYDTLNSWASNWVNARFLNSALFFNVGTTATVDVTVGVPATGWYNINVMAGEWGDGSGTIEGNFTITDEKGDVIDYTGTTSSNRWSYRSAPTSIYLVKGDRVLTLKFENTTDNHGVVGIKLVAE